MPKQGNRKYCTYCQSSISRSHYYSFGHNKGLCAKFRKHTSLSSIHNQRVENQQNSVIFSKQSGEECGLEHQHQSADSRVPPPDVAADDTIDFELNDVTDGKEKLYFSIFYFCTIKLAF